MRPNCRSLSLASLGELELEMVTPALRSLPRRRCGTGFGSPCVSTCNSIRYHIWRLCPFGISRAQVHSLLVPEKNMLLQQEQWPRRTQSIVPTASPLVMIWAYSPIVLLPRPKGELFSGCTGRQRNQAGYAAEVRGQVSRWYRMGYAHLPWSFL
jgi:hypothetical protein